ncbi:MAG: helix-turn-helix domain-containing protein [Actinomycetota bacterium]
MTIERWNARNPDFDDAFERGDWGYLVEFARTSAGLGQALLAERLQCNQSAVSRIESGAHTPAIRTLARVAAETGCVLEICMRAPKQAHAATFEGSAYAFRRGELRRAARLEAAAGALYRRFGPQRA